MSTVRVKDINIYYEIHGDGFPLVMIRGLSSDVHRWPPNFIDMLSKYFKTILFDNRGAGRTDKPDIEYSIKMMAEDTVELIDALNIDQVNVLGISMGGLIAQQMSLSYPQRIKKLILCSTFPGGSKKIVPSQEAMEFLRRDWGDLPPEEIVRLNIPFLFTEEFIRNKKDHIENYIQRALISPASPIGVARQKAAGSNYRVSRELKRVTTPTLILHGK
ncbi:MAG: alpha/beta fold hydrolase, partial [Promethearchaeota archaeon]